MAVAIDEIHVDGEIVFLAQAVQERSG